MGDRALVVVDVEVGQELLAACLRPLGEQSGELVDGVVEPVDVCVDLEPVARRDRGRLGDVGALDDLAEKLQYGVAVEREALQHRDRRRPVGDPHDQDAHPTTSGSPTPAALRCSW